MRSAEFNREFVLNAAMEAFIEKGYHKTSMQDLKKATGLHPGSIYCAFENKRGLLIAALEHYKTSKQQAFQTLIQASGSAIHAIEQYLEQVLNECLQERIVDCLLQKALSEITETDPEIEALIQSMLDAWQASLSQLFQHAIDEGSLSQETQAAAATEFFIMGIYGMRVFSHRKPPASVLENMARHLQMTIKKYPFN